MASAVAACAVRRASLHSRAKRPKTRSMRSSGAPRVATLGRIAKSSVDFGEGLVALDASRIEKDGFFELGDSFAGLREQGCLDLADGRDPAGLERHLERHRLLGDFFDGLTEC